MAKERDNKENRSFFRNQRDASLPTTESKIEEEQESIHTDNIKHADQSFNES